MLLQYDWSVDQGEPPDVGVWLEVSGDPDRPTLKGVVARHVDGEDGVTALSIMLADGQPGAEDLQEWIMAEGDLGVGACAPTRPPWR